jgi:cytochrome b subunit of formate dehydrogenase
MSATPSDAPTVYRRFRLEQQIEHVILLSAFVTLAATGLPQKFAGAGWADALIQVLGGIESVRRIHRVAATVLMLEAIFHFTAVAYRVWVRRVRLTMLPTVQDAVDAWRAFSYNLGLSKRPPQLGRYTFEEKVEYWSLIWGTVVMIITGFMMWNPIATTRFFPGQVIPAAKAAHGGEALLAVAAIILWHMWSVHARHFNRSMWTGKLSAEEMLHEHPLELADIKAGLAERPVDPARVRARQRRFFPVAGVVSLALAGGVYWFVTFEQTALAVAPPAVTQQAFVPETPTPLPPTATPPPVGALTWNGYVSTLLEVKCTGCHGQAAGLSLGSYAEALKGSRNGPVIVPGDSANSKLLAIQSAGTHPGQLSAEELARVKQWIDAGAPEQ